MNRTIENDEHLDEQVGYLTFLDGHFAIVGQCCSSEGTRVFHENIYPYRQDCACCGKTLVEPQSTRWPQLFDSLQSKTL